MHKVSIMYKQSNLGNNNSAGVPTTKYHIRNVLDGERPSIHLVCNRGEYRKSNLIEVKA